VVWEICFLLLLSSNSEEIRWIVAQHDGFHEGSGSIYDVNNFLKVMTWRIRFPDDEAEMVSSSRNSKKKDSNF
jgi:hypothetical protein